jgi:hypothetical protein
VKRQLWEEEVEKRVTTSIHDRIFAPKTSDDIERDFKLQGKLRALVVVGVTLEHLGIELTEREKTLLHPAVETIGKGYLLFITVNCRVACSGFSEMS